MKFAELKLANNCWKMLSRVAIAALGVAVSTSAYASDYPSKPITMIVPFKAGGSTETMAQVLSKALGKAMDTKVIVKTRPGGGGAVGMTFLSTQKPDGYTIGFSTLVSMTAEPLLKPDLAYTDESFTYVAGVSEYQMAFITTPDKPYKTFKELIEHSKKGNSLNVADQSGLSRSIINFIAKKEGVDWTAIPTRGGGEMVPFVLGGKVDWAWSGGVHQKYGDQMLVLASCLPGRLAASPEAPSIKELYGISMPGNAVIAAPKGVSPEVVAKLEAGIKAALDDPDFTVILAKLKFPKMFVSAEDMKVVVKDAVTSLKSVVAKQ
jgi:tripartite-type tricarboxylate transporter receptor subunit TctC